MHGQYFEFVKDEKFANSFIDRLNISKMTSMEEFRLSKQRLNSCDVQSHTYTRNNEEIAEGCNEIFSELHFMKSLIYAHKNYSWSKQTKTKAIKKIFEYINYKVSDEAPLISNLVVVALLEKLNETNVINKTFKNKRNQRTWNKFNGTT